MTLTLFTLGNVQQFNGHFFPDINECATEPDSCNANADCTNTDGSYVCACKSGYAGNGFSCSGNACMI